MSVSRLDWMPLFVRDYLADTQHLSALRHGIYLLLIMAYWVSGKPLPDDDNHLATVARVSPREWKMHRNIIAAFFQVADGVWRHKRIDHELANAKSISKERSTAGAKGAAKRWPSHSKTIAEPMASSSQIDAPIPVPIPREDSPPISPPEGGNARKANGHVARSRAARLPSDWQPTAEDSAFAASLGLDSEAVAAEFRDYWAGEGGQRARKVNWSGTYRNRCRQLAERKSPTQRLGPATGIAAGFAEALRRERDPDSGPH